MFPFRRAAVALLIASRQPKLGPGEAHVNFTTAMPWDMDMFMELNNGRTLTLYDIGRFALAQRGGLLAAIRARKWGLTMAGSAAQYRKKVRMFDRIEMRSRAAGRDDRFFYLEQTMYVRGTPTSNVMFRAAITDRNGLVATDEVAAQMGQEDWRPELPKWAADWSAAEAERPWPPEPMA